MMQMFQNFVMYRCCNKKNIVFSTETMEIFRFVFNVSNVPDRNSQCSVSLNQLISLYNLLAAFHD